MAPLPLPGQGLPPSLCPTQVGLFYLPIALGELWLAGPFAMGEGSLSALGVFGDGWGGGNKRIMKKCYFPLCGLTPLSSFLLG